jgi:type II secretory pathway component PulF
MSNLCRSGISLLSSLELLAEQRIISASFYQNLTSALQAGHPLSAALKKQNFSELYVSFIRAAEEHGDYAFGFKQCEQYYTMRANFAHELLQASAYPLLMLALVTVTFTFMITVVLPRFAELYQMMGLELPWMTISLFYFFEGLRILLFLLAGSLCVLFMMTKVMQRQPKEKRAIYTRRLYGLPGIKHISQFWMTHYLSIQLGSLLQAGVPLLQALHLIEGMTPWSYLSLHIGEIKTKITQGIPLHQSLANENFRLFLPSLARMVAIGEKTGRLDEMLLSLAEWTQQWMKKKADRFIKGLGPVLILGVGAIVALTVMAMFLPMLQLIKAM